MALRLWNIATAWRTDLVGRHRRTVAAINALESEVSQLDNDALRTASLALRHRARSGEALDALLPEAFALVREATQRTLRMRHYDVQLLAGAVLHDRAVAEMQTGEGKTLTAALPLYLNSLTGRGVQLATANDYLAERDASLVRLPLALLGTSTGLITGAIKPCDRRQAYRADVVYGTVKEFGFDFLRDRLQSERQRFTNLLSTRETAVATEPTQRPPHFLLVDEADAACIDEADMPLVIGAADDAEGSVDEVAYRWCAKHAEQFVEGTHYLRLPPSRRIELTFAGRSLIRALPRSPDVDRIGVTSLYEFIERALRAQLDFHRDRDYVIIDDEVLIIDPQTGRASPGRRWQDGLHEAIEAREGLPIRSGGGQAAQVTVQRFLLRYPRLAGMTGTIAGAARELRRVYDLRVASIPTNRPANRTALPTKIFGNADAKEEAVLAEVREMHTVGRPLLIGTRSIEKSDRLAERLRSEGFAPQVLHALHAPREAAIIAAAGRRGAITVATNMAGRGTDIRLEKGVAELSGLHVVCTELYDSPRLDRQQIGRAARQGDPGSHRTFLALDDAVLTEGLTPATAERLCRLGAGSESTFDGYLRYFTQAQRNCEARRARRRAVLLLTETEHRRACEDLGIDPHLEAA